MMQRGPYLVIAALLISPVRPCAAQPAPVAADIQEEQSWLKGWEGRAERLREYRRVKPEEVPDAVKIEAAQWLKKDAGMSRRHFLRTGEGLSEAYGDYYIELTVFLVGLRDPRSIPALLEVMDVARGVSTTLAEFGEAAVQPVAQKLSDSFLRHDAIFTLGKFLQGYRIGKSKITRGSFNRIKRALLELTRDPEELARQMAAEALGHAGPDEEVTRRLSELAKSDPYQTLDHRRKPPAPFYPVRDAAEKALERIASGNP